LGNSDGKVRVNRGGNHAINTALRMIAITQARGVGLGHGYLDKFTARGKTRTEALRLLRRQLSDAVLYAPTNEPAPPKPRLLMPRCRPA
jgi:transposase